MNKRVYIFAALCFALFFGMFFSPSITGKATEEFPEEVIVVLKPGSTNAITGAVVLDQEGIPSKEAIKEAQEEVLEDINSPSIVESFLGIETVEVEAKEKLEVVPAMIVEATSDGIDALQHHPLVEEIYPNVLLDLYLDESSALIEVPPVHTTDLNGELITGVGVKAAILDTGIGDHSDLTNVNEQCFCSPNCCPNGQATDTDADDDHGHGTHVAGVFAANGALTGVAPSSELFAVKVCHSFGCRAFDIIQGIDYAVQQDVDIISLSLGDSGKYFKATGSSQDNCPTFMNSALKVAASSDISIFVAAGNNGYADEMSYPACSQYVTSVGATDKSGILAPFSNLGEVNAPGSQVISTLPGGIQGSASGTSQSTPMVAGVAALIKQVNPSATVEEIKNILVSTGNIIPPATAPFVNARSAVESLGVVVSQPTPPPPPAPPAPQLGVPTISSPVMSAQTDRIVDLRGNAVDNNGNQIVDNNLKWVEEGVELGSGGTLRQEFTEGSHKIFLQATDGVATIGETSVVFDVSYCTFEFDKNGNARLDFADVMEFYRNFVRQTPCEAASLAATCRVYADQNENGGFDFGDITTLFREFIRGEVTDISGNTC